MSEDRTPMSVKEELDFAVEDMTNVKDGLIAAVSSVSDDMVQTKVASAVSTLDTLITHTKAADPEKLTMGDLVTLNTSIEHAMADAMSVCAGCSCTSSSCKK